MPKKKEQKQYHVSFGDKKQSSLPWNNSKKTPLSRSKALAIALLCVIVLVVVLSVALIIIFIPRTSADSVEKDGMLFKEHSKGYAFVGVIEGFDAQTLEIPEKVNGKSVTRIDERALKGQDSLVSVTIPNGVVSIHAEAFADCKNLEKVTIPASVITVAASAFNGTFDSDKESKQGWQDDDVKHRGITWTYNPTLAGQKATDVFKNKLRHAIIPVGTTEIIKNTFWDCRGLLTVDIAEGVTMIQGGVFYNAQELTTVNLPSSLKTIGDSAFRICINLENIVLPDRLEYIGEYAFAYNYKMSSITIPESVTHIGQFAFEHCNALSAINVVALTSAPSTWSPFWHQKNLALSSTFHVVNWGVEAENE